MLDSTVQTPTTPAPVIHMPVIVEAPPAPLELVSSTGKKLTSKWRPRERTFEEISADLHAKLPSRMLKTKVQGGNTVTFIPWYRAAKLLDYFAPGWSKKCSYVAEHGSRIIVSVSITIPCKDGEYTREAYGQEKTDKKGWGDPVTSAESQAFRRAAANFGLGLYLYEKTSDEDE